MAVLKQVRHDQVDVLGRQFPRLKGRGRIEARQRKCLKENSILSFPRLKGRGRIEAAMTQQCHVVPRVSFPRLKGRGRIEAVMFAWAPWASLGSFHG